MLVKDHSLWFLCGLAGIPFFGVGQSYTNIAPEQGIDLMVVTDLYGNGVSFFDFNQDGWDDLTFCMSNDSIAFYVNNGGTFELLPSFIYSEGLTRQVTWVDFDNDGDYDLFVTSSGKPYKLYENDGNFNFTDISSSAGFGFGLAKYYGHSWEDYDRDGLLDVYICTYEQDGTPADYEKLNHLYRNNGDGTFTDVTLSAGVGDGIKLSFQSVWMDYDMDGWPDLFIINDRIYANSMYRNNGNGTFSYMTLQTGVGLALQDPMTNTVGDFDNDGDLDIFMTNTGIINKPFRLLVNNGNGTFTESAAAYGLNLFAWTWGATWVDYDNNGWQDLYVCSAHPTTAQVNNFFRVSQQGTTFADSIQLFSPPLIAASFSVAWGDINNDGYPDLAVQNRTPVPPYLYQNSGGDNHWVKVSLSGTKSNRMAISSWIRVYANGMQQTHYTLCGQNYMNQNSQHHLFGLGQAQIVDSIQVVYLSGHSDWYYGLPVDTAFHFIEGASYQAYISAPQGLTGCPGESLLLDAGNHASVLWNTGDTIGIIQVNTSGSYAFQAWNEFGVWTFSDTVWVEVASAPEVSPTLTPNACNGQANGEINLDITGITEPYQVSWSNGGSGSDMGNLIAGEYGFVITYADDCQYTGWVLLEDPPLLEWWVMSFADAGSGAGSIAAQAWGGSPPYQFQINGAAVSMPVNFLLAGSYLLTLTDGNGCTADSLVQVELASAVGQVPSNKTHVFPNPTGDYLHVRVESDLRQATLRDGLGRVVMDSPELADRFTWYVKKLPAGVYMLELIDKDGFSTFRRIVKD